MGTAKHRRTGVGRRNVGPGMLLGAVLVLGGARTSPAIVNGTLDLTNEAVGSYMSGASSCSGVMIHTDGDVGWVLTSSLCVGGPLGVFLLGSDWTDPDWVFTVTERHVHPGAATNPDLSFALLRVDGATATTPVLPPLPPADDDISVGSELMISGFGQTESGSTSMRHLGIVIASSVSATQIVSQSSANACFGDTGGAAVLQAPGGRWLAGTIMNGDCSTFTGAGRVSAIYEDFIVPVINGLPLPVFADGFESGGTTAWSATVP